MEVNRLLGDEVTYELSIRGLPVEGTLDRKRAVLREALKEERSGIRSSHCAVNLDPLHEMSICSGKLGDLEDSIKCFNSSNRVNEYKRISARLIHLNLRLIRLQCDDANITSKLTTLLNLHNQLSIELKTAYETSEQSDQSTSNLHLSLLDTPVPLLPEIVGPQHTRSIIEAENNEDGRINNRVRHESLLNASLQEAKQVSTAFQTGRVSALRQVFEHGHSSTLNRESSSADLNRLYSPSNSTTSDHLEEPILNSELFDRFSNLANSSMYSDSNERYNQFSEDFTDTRRVSFSNDTFKPSKRTNPSFYSPNLCNSFKNMELDHKSPIFNNPSFDHNSHFYENTSQNFDISRWRLQYDGVSSVNSFLERLEELRLSRGVSKERLLRSAPELFTKDALLWYRMGRFHTWDELVTNLRVAFQPHDYEFALWEEIRRRTQGSQERVINYISVMENMFKKLEIPPSEQTRVQLIKRNMLPYIQTALSLKNVNSISELCNFGKSIEETESRVRQYCPPPSNVRSLVEPELAYRKSINPSFPVAEIVHSRNTVTAAQTQPICWNCGSEKHKFRNCNQTKKLFCFKCGLEGVTSKSCSRCSKNGKIPSTQ